MSFIAKLQNQPHDKKVRLIWITVIAVAILLAVVWILTSRIGEVVPKDTSLFKSFGQGLKDIRGEYSK
jgi:hypothetical protein